MNDTSRIEFSNLVLSFLNLFKNWEDKAPRKKNVKNPRHWYPQVTQ